MIQTTIKRKSDGVLYHRSVRPAGALFVEPLWLDSYREAYEVVEETLPEWAVGGSLVGRLAEYSTEELESEVLRRQNEDYASWSARITAGLSVEESS